MRKRRTRRALCCRTELSMLDQRRRITLVSVHLWSVKTKNRQWVSLTGNFANIRRRLPNLPIFKLLNGSVYCPTNSLPDAESWSSTVKRTSASSGTNTSNWKFSFHSGLKPSTEKEDIIISDLMYHRRYASLISDTFLRVIWWLFNLPRLLLLQRLPLFPWIH